MGILLFCADERHRRRERDVTPLRDNGANRLPGDAVTTSLVCVFIAFLLIYLPKIPLSVAMAKSPGGYDNRQPRDQQATLEGWARRAAAAHANGFESFAPFAAAVFTAHLARVDPQTSASLAIVHVAARAIYPVVYIAGIHVVRSTVWFVGFCATVGLFIAGVLG
jgi:uncharacterized MAPEG superfamily protein